MTGQMLRDKVVIITGAARGLGEAHARACAAEGAAVVVTDIEQGEVERVAEEIRSAGGVALAVGGDISSWAVCEQVVDVAKREFGRVDGLVNNAAITIPTAPFEETEELIRRHFEVNVYGTFFMSIVASRAMNGKGSIVNTTSGSQSGTPFSSMYGATKGAISSLTYCWALDFAAAGSQVRVNALSPHAATPMMTASAEFFKDKGISSKLKSAAPDPSTVSPVVVYLLSDSSNQVNGQVVRMQDGRLLSLTTHPANLNPPLYRDSWTPQDIAAAFEDELTAKQLPTGATYYNATVVEPPTDLATFVPRALTEVTPTPVTGSGV